MALTRMLAGRSMDDGACRVQDVPSTGETFWQGFLQKSAALQTLKTLKTEEARPQAKEAFVES